MERFRQRARKLRASQTSAEARLWQALRGRRLAAWKFRRQHPIDRYVVDFVTVEGRLIVEVDGVTHETDRELFRDAERTRILEAFGYNVVRVSNIDVYENLGGVLDMIDQTLRPMWGQAPLTRSLRERPLPNGER
jgi:very-short-patch-repair endonuclease